MIWNWKKSGQAWGENRSDEGGKTITRVHDSYPQSLYYSSNVLRTGFSPHKKAYRTGTVRRMSELGLASASLRIESNSNMKEVVCIDYWMCSFGFSY